MKIKLLLLATLFAAFMFTGCNCCKGGGGDSNSTASTTSN